MTLLHPRFGAYTMVAALIGMAIWPTPSNLPAKNSRTSAASYMAAVGEAPPFQATVNTSCPPNVCINTADNNPITFLVGGVPTATIDATGINMTGSKTFTGTGTARGAVKGSNTARNANTVLAADPDMVFTTKAGEVYRFQYLLAWDGSTTADIKFNMSVPANNSYQIGATCLDITTITNVRNTATSSGGADVTCGGAGIGTFLYTVLDGFVSASASAAPGTVSLTWAQNTSDATNTTMYSGSLVTFTRIR